MLIQRTCSISTALTERIKRYLTESEYETSNEKVRHALTNRRPKLLLSDAPFHFFQLILENSSFNQVTGIWMDIIETHKSCGYEVISNEDKLCKLLVFLYQFTKLMRSQDIFPTVTK